MTIPSDNYDYLSWKGQYGGGIGGGLGFPARLKLSSTDPIKGEIRYYRSPSGPHSPEDIQPGASPFCTATWSETQRTPDSPGPSGEPPSEISRVVHEQATSGDCASNFTLGWPTGGWDLRISKDSSNGTWEQVEAIPDRSGPVDNPNGNYDWTKLEFYVHLQKGEWQ
jgi:hypothetical protein